MKALLLGVIGRTVQISKKINLACLSELTQHQLAVAVLASGESKEAFYAGLFHDIYKVAMNWHEESDNWKWRHIPYKSDRDKSRRLFMNVLSPLTDLGVDLWKVADLCASHHSHDKRNPICKVEKKGVKLVEVRTPSFKREIEEIACHLLSLNTRGPYRTFIALLLIEKFLDRLNEAYAHFFSEEFNLRALHVRYLFKEYERGIYLDPKVDFRNGLLNIELMVRSTPSLNGLILEHDYSFNPKEDSRLEMRRPELKVQDNNVKLKLRFSDALTFPTLTENGISIWALAPLIHLKRAKNIRSKMRRYFNEALKRAVEDLVELARDAMNKILRKKKLSTNTKTINEIKINLLDDIQTYKPAHKEPCMFCGAEAHFKVAGSLARFVDIDRIISFNNMACASCKLAYTLEEARRMSVPLCITPLPANPNQAKPLSNFASDIAPNFDTILTHELPPVKTALEEPWARILSGAFYNAILTNPDDYGLRKMKSERDLNTELFKFFLTRESLLYPFVFKIRPVALISAWTKARQKKFILNVDSTSDFIILPGAERDLTLEDLSVLEPLASESEKALQNAYRVIRRMYELR